ncbi:MAG: hypothetical protein Q8942_18705 [Bacillota bacterium]|nr:hypothetical protein [Bacillota bacterium]
MKIEGFFAELKKANETVEKLKASGFKNAFIDMNEHYNDERNVQANLPGTETSVSLSGLVLESGTHGIDRDKAPLTAASPMVSGFGKFEEVADVNCKVIVEAGDNADKAKQIIQEMGGSLESPNFRKPNIENREERAIFDTLNDNRRFLEQEQKDGR